MAKLKRMDQVMAILRTYLETESIKATSRRLKVSKNTVRTYVRRVSGLGEDLKTILELGQEEVMRICTPAEDETRSTEEDFESQVDYWIDELRRVGVTRQLLWEEYRERYAGGYSYSQFCERLRRAIGRRDLTLSLDHTPGEVMQADFAGKQMHWVDRHSGEVYSCEVLVCVMPHSHYSFAFAVPSQQIPDLVHGLNQALLFFGKVPKVLLSDNLKSYVTKSDRYEPTFTELCQQLGAHYQFDLQATRVAKPKDKASVENMVGTVYNRIYGPLRNEVFHSLEDLNAAIRRQLIIHNKKPYQKKRGCRQDIFDKYEAVVMRDLPCELFEIKKMTKAMVQRNYHVFVGEEKNYYSVPYQYVGKTTTVLYTSSTVEIYLDHQRIAIHARLVSKDSYQHQTNKEHMPNNHREWQKARGYNAAYFQRQAEKIGPATRWAISHVLVSRTHPPQSFNSCKGILSLAKKYSCERLEKACLRCQQVDKTSYSMLKRILAMNLDQHSDQPELFSTPEHNNIRGAQAYQ